MAAPQRELTRVNTRFEWIPACQKAFKEPKRRFSDKMVLVPYVPHLDTRL